MTTRFTDKWSVAGYAKLSSSLDLYQQNVVNSVFDSFFNIHTVQVGPLNEKINNVNFNPIVGLTYTLGTHICTVSRNVGMHEEIKLKKSVQENIIENISMISIPFQKHQGTN